MAGDNIDVVLAADGRIAAVQPSGTADVDGESIDLEGRLLLPAAVEPHAHLDKAFLAEVIHNPSGDLMGAIMAMRANRHLLGVDETIERAERAARRLASNGVVAVRTHADVTIEHGLTSIEALVEVRDRVSDVIDVEIAALCGWPVTGAAGADHRALFADALDAGADIVGGCPHLEIHSEGGTVEASTDVLLQFAADRGLPVDLHTDEHLEPGAHGLEVLAQRVLDGFDLPTTASHCVSLGQCPPAEQERIAEMVAEAGINVITLPHTNLFLQGRGVAPMPRALTAVDVLQRAGVNVAAGADNLQDPFNPVGRACPFETAGLMIMAAHLLPHDAWSAVSTAAARTLGRYDAGEPSGLEVGARADLVAVAADGVRAAIADGAHDVWVWKHGQRTH